jgi:hypothetical protein
MESLATQTWQLNDGTAFLDVGKLSGTVRAAHPAHGLSAIQWNSLPVGGQILGVTAGAASMSAGPILLGQLSEKGCRAETFVRGDDFVANFAQRDRLPFSCQIYWRAVSQANHVVVLDTIISVQTELLESFPQIAVETRLASEEVWFVDGGADSAHPIKDHAAVQFTDQKTCCLVLRAPTANWSYAEMSHPADRGTWKIEQSASGERLVQRQFDGAFLEKGVIRRLRVRGAFLPRDNDMQLAAECYASLAAEAPPLTA